MKRLLGLVVVLAVLVLGGYYAMGVVTERTVHNTVGTINKNKDVHAEISSYKRSWFHSKAVIDWTVHVPEHTAVNNGQTMTLPAEDYKLSMPLTIYHGPVMFSPEGVHFGMGYAATDITIPEKYQAEYKSTFTEVSGSPHVVLTLLINYLNHSQVGMEIPAFKVMIKKDNSEFDWLGMVYTMSVGRDAGTLKGNLDVNGLKGGKADSMIDMGRFQADYDLYQSASGMYLGEANIDFPSISATENQKKVFEMNGFTMSSSAEVSSDLLNTYFSATLQDLMANDQKYGPGALEIAFRNLDPEAVAVINQQARIANTASSDTEKQQALMAILPQLPKLFSHGPEFEISKFDLTIPQGKLNGNLLISLPVGEIKSTFEVVTKLQGKGKLQMPAKLVESLLTQSFRQQLTQDTQLQQALTQQLQGGAAAQSAAANPDQFVASKVQEKLNNLVDSGMIEKSGDDFIVTFELSNGQLTVNGKPFSPAMLKF